MKKKTASAASPVPSTAKTPVLRRTTRSSTAKATVAAEKAKPDSTDKPRKSLLSAAVESAKKILKPAKKTVAAAKPAKSINSTTKAKTVPARPKTTRQKPVEIPSILLEDDFPMPAAAAGPGQKYSLGATPPPQHFSGGELPESYGTKKLFLTARDPHWLYAHWDLTRDQQRELNAESTDGHLILRIFIGKIEGHPAHEIHVHPESRHWFAHVERAGQSYAAELGYYSAVGKWTRVAVSSGTVTPPEAASKEDTAEFATIPFEFPFAKLMQIIEDAVRDNIPLAQAIEDLRRHGHPDLPRMGSVTSRAFHQKNSAPSVPAKSPVWTPEQEKALAEIINIDSTRHVWMGSLEITELIRRRLTQDVNPPTSPMTAFGVSSPGIASSPSSPFGGMPEKSKGFWFNVNAELVIYGATEPDARVTLGGHEIKLRSDGTFSFRFALPDGKYDLPAVAVSADGTDGRAAELKFSRQTEYMGDVGSTPQDPSLKPPTPDNI